MLSNDDRMSRYEFGHSLVQEAGSLALHHFQKRHELTVEEKGVQDLVSRADREVEDIIRRSIASRFPADAVVGEEAGGEYASHFWIIDPIDGTSNFLRGIPYWCVALAFVEGTEASLAFTFDPVHNLLYTAKAGDGAKRNGETIRVTERSIEQSCVSLAHSAKQPVERYLQAVTKLSASRVEHRRMGSIAMSLALLAEGTLDGVMSGGTNSWDVMGGLLLAQEAGGFATMFDTPESLGQRRAIAASTQSLAPIIEDVAGLKLIP